MQSIKIANLLYMLIPIGIVGYFYFRWVGEKREIAYATLRMISQLLLIGYALDFIFRKQNSLFGLLIVIFMIAVSSLIALRNFKEQNSKNYIILFSSIAIGGTLNLLIVTILVLDLTPLYQPKIIIPLAGMIYANAMNAVAIAAERYEHEIGSNSYNRARADALKASMIPQINTFLAVGLVSLPGMMTGQILSGVDPLIAVRYQIVVMAMVLGSSGISTLLFLYWRSPTPSHQN